MPTGCYEPGRTSVFTSIYLPSIRVLQTPVKPGERTLAQGSLPIATALDTSDTNTVGSCVQRVEWRDIASWAAIFWPLRRLASFLAA